MVDARPVAIRILVPNEHNDNQSVRHTSQYAYEELLQSCVRIYELKPTFIHTKLLIVDGVWSVIGSTNMDNRSRKINDEIVFGISDAGFARTLEGTIARDLRRSTEIMRASWEKRGFWQKFLEVSAQAFVQQY
jgi:cardiolipin synthase